MTDMEREEHQLREGIEYYLALASVISLPSDIANSTLQELKDLSDSLHRDRPLFQKGAHLGSAAIRLCTLAQLLKGDTNQYKISVAFYESAGGPIKNERSRSEILCEIRKDLPRYVAFLIRDTLVHPEVDPEQPYWEDKQYYLLNLTPAEVQEALHTFYEQLK